MLHHNHDRPEILISLELTTLEAEVAGELAQTDRAKGEWLLVGLVQLRGPVHQALVRLAVAH